MIQNPRPYRAEHVGSLLRPAALLDARQQYAEGKISAAALRDAEDTAIVAAIQQQEAVGLHSISDGEFRLVTSRAK